MDKAQMIQAIIGKAVHSATVAGKKVNTTDLFFSLAFTDDKKLKAMCKKLGIAA